MPAKAKNDAIADAIKSLAGAIQGLEGKVDELLKKDSTIYGTTTLQGPGTEQANPKPEGEAITADQVSETKEEENQVPFPMEWREVINEVLNTNFDAKVVYLENAMFELTIYVPKEYSNAPQKVWDMDHADRRVTRMQNYMGAAGVRQYCEKIAENLGQEIRAKINDDRAKLVHA